MANALRNNVGTAASSAASPTSITPALTSPALQGSLVVLAVVVTGTSPTITTPAGWTLVQSGGPAGLAIAKFIQYQASGGLTSVVVTVGGTGGGAVAVIGEITGNFLASIYPEFPSMFVPPSLDTTSTAGGTGTIYGNLVLTATVAVNQLLTLLVGFAATTITPANSNDWQSVGSVVSTNGVPNAQASLFWAQSSLNRPVPITGGSFGASVVNQWITSRYHVLGEEVPQYTGGTMGVYVFGG